MTAVKVRTAEKLPASQVLWVSCAAGMRSCEVQLLLQDSWGKRLAIERMLSIKLEQKDPTCASGVFPSPKSVTLPH